MSDLPVITVLIANCNYEEYLAQAISSAKNQSYPNIHICVIDDSSDNIEEVQRIVTEELYHEDEPDQEMVDENVEIWKTPNVTTIYLSGGPYGPSTSRNFGIHYTKEFTHAYLVLDADDEAYYRKAELLFNTMQESERIGVVYADYHIYNTVTGVKRNEFKEPYSFARLRQECIVHSGSLIRKTALEDVLEETGFYDSTLRVAEDWDLWLRISEKYMIAHVPEFLSLVRIQPKNSTDTVRQDIWNQCWQRVRDKAISRSQ